MDIFVILSPAEAGALQATANGWGSGSPFAVGVWGDIEPTLLADSVFRRLFGCWTAGRHISTFSLQHTDFMGWREIWVVCSERGLAKLESISWSFVGPGLRQQLRCSMAWHAPLMASGGLGTCRSHIFISTTCKHRRWKGSCIKAQHDQCQDRSGLGREGTRGRSARSLLPSSVSFIPFLLTRIVFRLLVNKTVQNLLPCILNDTKSSL